MNKIDIKSILDFSAFRPEPDDPSAPWKKRFPDVKTAYLGLGRAKITWREISLSPPYPPLDSVPGEYKETLPQLAETIKTQTGNNWCSVSINSRYVVSLETNLSRRAGSEEMLKTNARGVLGGRYEKGKIYAVTHNPETNSSILMSFDEDFLKKIEAQFKEAGLRIGRLCCGTYVLLRHALSATNTTKGTDQPVSSFFIVCCEGAVCALVQHQDRWLELRSRTDVYEEDFSPVADLLAPFESRLPPEIGITLIGDEPLQGLSDRLAAVFPSRSINDLSEPGLLAGLLVNN
jgi:hypothetical protein